MNLQISTALKSIEVKYPRLISDAPTFTTLFANKSGKLFIQFRFN